MAWIKLRTDLLNDPAVYRLAAALGQDRYSMVGRLAAFWGWADQHAVDGAVDGATSQVVDDVVSLPGFADALAAVKWLRIEADGVVIPNHDRHNGANAKERSLKSERQAKWRAGKAPETQPKTVDDKPSTSPSTREEKIREEDKKKPTASSADKLPPCPHREILALFAEHLPALPQPKPELWSGARAKHLAARWRWLLTATKRGGERYATTEAEALEWLGRFFAYVAGSDFLTGRTGKFTGCDLGWLMNEENFAKVLQGNYENREAA